MKTGQKLYTDFPNNAYIFLLTLLCLLTIISVALNKKSAQKQKRLNQTTASRKPLFYEKTKLQKFKISHQTTRLPL
jgi:hypothetical protein